MVLEVYPDIIFVLNFFVDLVLLYLLKKVNQKRSSRKRLALAAAAGAMFAVITGIFPQMNLLLRFFLMNIAANFSMVMLAFGKMKKADLAKQMLVLYLITYFAGGFIHSLYYNTGLRPTLQKLMNAFIVSNISWKSVIAVMLVLLPISLLILWVLRLYKSKERKTFEVKLFLDNRSIHTKGLMDTGNCLYDPIFHKPVVIIENELLAELLSDDCRMDFEKMKQHMRGKTSAEESADMGSGSMLSYRIIPYTSVGNPRGTMLGFVLDKILIYKEKETICKEKVTAAVCDNHLSTKDDYHLILHKDFID